jgi:hypothetical protein
LRFLAYAFHFGLARLITKIKETDNPNKKLLGHVASPIGLRAAWVKSLPR